MLVAETPLWTDQGHRQREHQRLLIHLSGGWCRGLTKLQDHASGVGVPLALNRQLRCPGLVVPTTETLWIKSQRLTSRRRSIDDGLNEVFRRGGRAIKTADIERHPTHEPLRSQQGVEHPDQFCPFLINRCCVEIIDRLVFRRLHRVSGRSSILSKLGVAQHRHILDPFHRRRMKISGEGLITEHRQAFLQ